MSPVAGGIARREIEALDLVRFRDVLSELVNKGQRDALLDLVLALLGHCKSLIDDQSHEIAALKKQLFGRKSERCAPVGQEELFPQLLKAVVAQAAPPLQPGQAAASSSEAARDAEESTSPGAAGPAGPEKPAKRKRKPLKPDRSEEILVPDEERPCPSCGRERCRMGHVRSIVVEYAPPSIEIIEYRREKLVCRPCDGEISAAPVPEEKVIEGARPGPRMLSALAIHKVVDGLPLNRTRLMFGRIGKDLPMQTLNRWEALGHELLMPVARRLARWVVQEADIINLDDTGLRVRDPDHEDGIRHGHIWTFVGRKFDPSGDLSKTQVLATYLYAPTWEAKYPQQFLEKCRAMLQGDGYAGYNPIATLPDGTIKNRLVGCLMHARRPFVAAMEANDPAALYFIEQFQVIYKIEAEAKERRLTAPQRLELRRTKSLPVMNAIHLKALELDPLPLLKPMRKGVGYFINQWPRLLIPFTEDGRLEVDNGEAERRLKPVASGRKSWLFAGSERGAVRFADTLSLVASAQANGLEPGRYLTALFEELPRKRRAEADLDIFLPHVWGTAEKAAQ